MSLLRRAYDKETNEFAKQHLKAMINAAEIGKKEKRPVCQDTGVPYYYVDIGSDVKIEGNIQTALDRATERATIEMPMRTNVVHPLKNVNPGTNVGWGVPYAYYYYKPGADYLEITAIPRGGRGMFPSIFRLPAVPVKGTRLDSIKKAIIDYAVNCRFACPPHVYGVVIGGNASHTVYLAERAVWRRPVGSLNPDPALANLEKELLEVINRLGIGPMGLGGDATAFAVHLEICGSHTAGPPVAVAVNCWSYRIATARIYADGSLEDITYGGM